MPLPEDPTVQGKVPLPTEWKGLLLLMEGLSQGHSPHSIPAFPLKQGWTVVPWSGATPHLFMTLVPPPHTHTDFLTPQSITREPGLGYVADQCLAPGSPLAEVLSTCRVSADMSSLVSLMHPFFCVPQPETEDEKKRFEEGKGRYLQMKAKRQGHTEPQP